MNKLSRLAPAKLNLYLHILGVRDDGYHTLESLVVFLDLADKLTYQPANDFSLTIDGPFGQGLDLADNLVTRAAQLLAAKANYQVQGHLHLEKNIPVAAGLGGGSSDAATTLLLLNEAWQLNVPFNDLSDLAKQLGADVQACLWRRPLIMRGIGDQIEIYDQDFPYQHVLLVNPRQALSTIKVYQRYDQLNQPGNVEERNDLTQAAIDLCPTIQVLLEELQQQEGCQIARMAGSGATCFGLFKSEDLCQKAYKTLQSQYPTYWWYPTKIKQGS